MITRIVGQHGLVSMCVLPGIPAQAATLRAYETPGLNVIPSWRTQSSYAGKSRKCRYFFGLRDCMLMFCGTITTRISGSWSAVSTVCGFVQSEYPYACPQNGDKETSVAKERRANSKSRPAARALATRSQWIDSCCSSSRCRRLDWFVRGRAFGSSGLDPRCGSTKPQGSPLRAR